MKIFQKCLVGMACVIGSISSANAGGVPVIDAAAIAQAVEQVAAWGKQNQQMIQQITQMKAQFDAMNGSRGIGSLLQNPQLYSYLPADFRTVLAADGSGGVGATALMNSLKLYGIEQTGIDPNSATAKLFKNGQNQNAVFRLTGEQGYQAMSDRVTQLAALTQSIDATTDPKAIAELQARIAAEQGFIANEQAKLNILAQMQAGQDRIRQQQGREILMNSVYGRVPRF